MCARRAMENLINSPVRSTKRHDTKAVDARGGS